MSATKTVAEDKVTVEFLVPFLIYRYVIGNVPSNDEMDLRILWQKVGYLAKQFGLPLNDFKFSWYLRGPYSKTYTSVLYDICENMGSILRLENDYGLTENASKNLTPLKNLAQDVPNDLSLSAWFELLASIHYIKKGSQGDRESVFKKLAKEKPHYKNQITNNYAWKVLQEANIM